MSADKVADVTRPRYNNRKKIWKLHFNHKNLWYAIFGGVTMQRILVVEDDFDIQELLQNFLQEAGYEVAVSN